VLVKNDEMFPADLILLASSNAQGQCFINTSSMDGEKNLKKRNIPKDLDKIIANGTEMPSVDSFKFEA
jgi:magnesium-transporting ATPase (P-type)